MTEDRGQGGDDVDGMDSDLPVERTGLGPSPQEGQGNGRGFALDAKQIGRDDDRQEALEEIEDEAEDAEALADYAKDVGGSNIS